MFEQNPPWFPENSCGSICNFIDLRNGFFRRFSGKPQFRQSSLKAHNQVGLEFAELELEVDLI